MTIDYSPMGKEYIFYSIKHSFPLCLHFCLCRNSCADYNSNTGIWHAGTNCGLGLSAVVKRQGEGKEEREVKERRRKDLLRARKMKLPLPAETLKEDLTGCM